MTNYQSGEFTDEFWHAQADPGDYFLDQEGFQYRLTQDEVVGASGDSATLYRKLLGK
jgi:hypothetical protein